MKKGVIASRVMFAGILTLLVFGREGTAQNTGLETAQKSLNNIALGKPYTMKPAPNYGLCTDENDRIELTDGKSFGSLHTSKTTVGWGWLKTEVVITIDLASVEPIRGVSYTTYAGTTDIGWPAGIFILVSDDGKSWNFLGDLTALGSVYGVPPEIGTVSHRYWTDQIQGHGRYVQLLVNPGGVYTFVDEVEIYRGEDEWVKLSNPEPVISDPEKHFADPSFLTRAAVQRRLFTDLSRSLDALDKPYVSKALKIRLKKELKEIRKNITGVPSVNDPEKFRSIFPLNELHARIFAVHGALAKSAGMSPLTVWTTNRFDFLTPTQQPTVEAMASLSIAAMKGETRSAAFNLTNSTEKLMAATVEIKGLPGGSNPECITFHQVEWTDTKEFVPISAALLPVACGGTGYPVSIPAGMTRQVWLNFAPRQMAAGVYRGRIVVKSPNALALEVPLTVRVFNETFPVAPTLHLAGFDYTNTDSQYAVTPENVEPLIAHIRARYVDTPWATNDAFVFGTHDDEGNMVKPPDTANFDRWVARWPGARRYAVFVNVGDMLDNLRRGTPAFNRAAGEWITFWVNHAGSKGIKPGQILLLLVDEPGNDEMAQKTIDWAKPIKVVQPGVVIWVDSTYSNPANALPGLYEVADIICPRRIYLWYAPAKAAEFYREYARAGHILELYDCSTPGFALDPYSYYRLLAWTCFDMRATGMNFYVAVSGRGRAWNEYISNFNNLGAVFLGPDSVTAAKHMEAAREGVQDYEYLVMLRDRIDRMGKTSPNHPMLAKAKSLLESACSRVLKAEGVVDTSWKSNKDRSIADQVCVDIGEMLEKIGNP